MNKIDLMEMLKNGGTAELFDWLKLTKFVSYGAVVEVIDAQTVRAAEIVKGGVAENNCLATWVVPSSALLETAVLPKQGDLVLLLFLQKYHRSMFDLHRKPEDRIIYDAQASGYNGHAALALPLSPLKMNSSTMFLFGGTAEKPSVSVNTLADWSAALRGSLAAFFDGEGDEEVPVSVIFGRKRPVTLDRRGKTLRKYGFVADTVDRELMETDAAVTEEYSIYAPVSRNIQGAQDTRIGLGTEPGGDPEGSPVETEAPVTEIIHGKAPVVRDIRSPQTLTVGIGNAESGDAAEERDAPVNETYGSKAPITKDIRGPQTYNIGTGPDGPTGAPVTIALDENADVTVVSKSALTAEITRAVNIVLKNVLTVEIAKAVTYTLKDALTAEVSKAVNITLKDILSVSADGDITIKSAGNINLDAGGNITATASKIFLNE
jgi:hypothetical protein